MAEEKSITEKEETGPPDQFVGRDLLESYIYYLNYVPSNPLERYGILVKAITFGMELLPYYDDPTETNKDQIQANKEKQEHVDNLYAEAKEVLNDEVPAKRRIEYTYVDHGGERFQIYKISAEEDKDAKPCEARKEELTPVLNNFVTMQHESHVPRLQIVHNQILHELTQADIVPSINPSFENMKDQMKKQFLNDIMNMPEPEIREKEDDVPEIKPPEPETKEGEDAIQ